MANLFSSVAKWLSSSHQQENILTEDLDDVEALSTFDVINHDDSQDDAASDKTLNMTRELPIIVDYNASDSKEEITQSSPVFLKKMTQELIYHRMLEAEGQIDNKEEFLDVELFTISELITWKSIAKEAILENIILHQKLTANDN